ncbi:nuclear transport factor 2 family protein [Bacillus sp. SD088]|uniref:nuclear transport factor 2 family protein n=1 Tax=Bacillus sp. SD088 TaxID=2782012 RepID=UPI001A96CD54|nr:nuclear transport factor 2 family protein [Bacillus sp. SD088]MBO0992732.1 nuclear transport factor 2 family protein [Bacillus sp. SD088]
MEEIELSNLVQKYFKAYETKEREMVEELLSPEFMFSSPVDEKISRETYFEKCWPSCIDIREYRIQNLFKDKNEVIIRYECIRKSGAVFQNMEHFRFTGNQIQEIIVYFGFDLRNELLADETVLKFNNAFATGDADFVIDNVIENVQWHLVGAAELQGREAVKNMLEPMRGVASNEYQTNNIITQGNKAVIEGTMRMPKANGQEKLYAFCDIYTFDGANNNKIQDLTAYLIELSSQEEMNREE